MNIKKKFATITYMKQQDRHNLIEFGKHVQNIRKRKSGSLNNIAFSRGGVTSATLSRIENGLVDFKFTTLLKLAHTLDVSLDELVSKFAYKNSIDQ